MINSLPTIPEYYKRFINNKVDLLSENKQCCPFHKEDTPSFSYNPTINKWRCFGSCKIGGDVVDLHKANYKLGSREEALVSLRRIYKIKEQNIEDIKLEAMMASNLDELKVGKEALVQIAIINAKGVERYLELDEIMATYPVDSDKLELLLKKWGCYNGA